MFRDGRVERGERTRHQVLLAARAVIESEGTGSLSMASVARSAGVSRRTVYDQFGSRAGLLVALAQEADRQIELDRRLGWVFSAPSAVEAIHRLIEVVAEVTPQLFHLASAVERARSEDPDANAAWEDRMADRMRGCVALVDRLDQERGLREGVAVQEGADILYMLISWQVWGILVEERGWTAQRWIDHTITAVDAMLLHK